MNVLLIGSGGREHALALKIAESPNLEKLYITPGNPGTAEVGENIDLDLTNHPKLIEFCNFNKIKLVVFGPEQPLVDGLADILRMNNLNVFGPNKDGAQLEGDKFFAKRLMANYCIPTAEYRRFKSEEYESAVKWLSAQEFPLVVKATGLAAGKGVLICKSYSEAVKALEECFIKKAFGESGDEVVIEKFLEGAEASIFVISDGFDYVSLPLSQDHKRAGDGDTGKNTGGMGAYAPAPIVSKLAHDSVEHEIIKPTIRALRDSGIDYRGCIYIGLMITKEGPQVIEYNCRFGDPETQAVLPLLEGDFLELLYTAAKGEISKSACKYNGGSAVCVVAASGGYPDKYEKGFEITGIKEAESDNVIVYHAGTKEDDGKIVTNGGRVLGVTSVLKEQDLITCKKIAYEAMDKISFDKIYYRRDISDKAFDKDPMS